MKTRILRHTSFAAAVLAAGCAAPVQPNVNVAERVATMAKPAVVQIYSGCYGAMTLGEYRIPLMNVSSGTGFFIHSEGYVMTNAHVVSATREGDEKCRVDMVAQKALELAQDGSKSAQEWFDLLMSKGQLVQAERVAQVVLQSGNNHPFEIKEYGAPAGEGRDMMFGKDVSILKIEVKNVPTLQLGDSSKMKVGDKVWVIGYPSKAYSGALDEKSARQPTTTGGAITSTMATADGAPVLGTDAAATNGNSGGPALDEHGRVVGLLTFGNRSSDTFNYLVASNTAKEFVPHAAGDKARSQVDQLWEEGLRHQWAGEDADAKRKFKRVVDLYPEHSEAPRLIAELNEKHGDEVEEGGLAAWLNLRVALAGLAALIGLTALVAFAAHVAGRRRRVPQPPRPVVAGYPAVARTLAYQGPRAPGARLACTSGALRGREFPVGGGIIIGRDPARAQIVVDDASVSGAHVWIGPVEGRIVAMDCGSLNGTFVNHHRQRLNRAALGAGDVVTVGPGTAMFALVA